MSQLRIFLVDDHALVREGLRAVLARQATMQVVGEAADGREALKVIERSSPDIIVMDISMPGLNGIEVTRQILKVHPKIKILALSMYDDQEYVYDILQAGASGYVLKNRASLELVNAIEAVSRGECYLCPIIAAKVVEQYVRRGDDGSVVGRPPELTCREREVLQLVVEGHSTPVSAGLLGISPKTVEVHRAHIASKLAIHDLPGLVRYAIRKGLIKV
jgi:DNA-binding NarL/FixJ family response regulator